MTKFIIGLLSKLRYIGGEKLVSKDQAIGGVIFIVCFIVAVGYFIALAFTPQLSDLFGWS